MTDFKDQLDLAAKAVDKVVEVTSIHGKENALQGGFGLDEKTVNELKALEAKYASEISDPRDAPREKLVEFYKAMYRIVGMDENFAEIAVDSILGTNALSVLADRLDQCS